MSSTPIPKSDVDVPSGRQLANRKSFRNSSIRRSDSFGDEAVAADDVNVITRDEDGAAENSRLSAVLAAEREETRLSLRRELEEAPPEQVVVVKGDDDDEEDDEEESGGAEAMSLMDLLEETDRKAGVDGPKYRFAEEEEEEEEEEEDEEGVEVCCCVCLVKHKGTILPVCGHTYCRMCSREMWVQKGHCPVCSNFVLEIMEIF